MTISDTARGQVFGQESGGFLELLVITSADLLTVWRFVNNTENVTSNGDLYIAYPFKAGLPKDRDRSAPAATLTIANVSREIGQAIRLQTVAPTVTITIVRLDDVDVIEQEFPPFKLRNAKYNNMTVTGDLSVDDMMREPFPQRTFTPSEYPGIF